MNKRFRTLTRLLGLALLLYSVGAAVVDTHAYVDSEATREQSSCDSSVTAQTCFTIDTSRPEWATRYIYLPLLLRGYL